jgi:hypothetical protein
MAERGGTMVGANPTTARHATTCLWTKERHFSGIAA